jgi:MoaA/NifB/PqqE/SkfB family radical SAM enzyme
MTVSCNCVDINGAGQIGDLTKQTFYEIFTGPIAQGFRRSLAMGKLPIAVCKECVELQEIDGEEPERYLSDYHLPTEGIMVENTVACNLRCLCCQREQLLQTRKRLRMSLDDLKKIAGIIYDNKIKKISYFNLGEPFLSKTIFKEVSILKNSNPNLQLCTSTNGLLLDDDEKIRAALLMDHIFFSIDGATQDVVSKYQVGADFKRSYENMKNLVQRRNQTGAETPLIEWKYVVFAFNDNVSEIKRAITLAKEANVDIISFWSGIGPQSFVSHKFYNDPYFLQLGDKSAHLKGVREIRFCTFSEDYLLLILMRMDPKNYNRLFTMIQSGEKTLTKVM